VPGLTCDQLEELWLGPKGKSLFRTRADLRAAWECGRDYCMALWGCNGRRPMAWWEFDSPIPFPGLERSTAALYEAGLLTEVEKVEFERSVGSRKRRR
jgi:hypothetical protein